MSGEARGFRVRGLGEIAIRCADLARMERFDAEVIGRERLAERSGGIVLFRIGPGDGGHTTVLALFGQGVFAGKPEGNTAELVAATPEGPR